MIRTTGLKTELCPCLRHSSSLLLPCPSSSLGSYLVQMPSRVKVTPLQLYDLAQDPGETHDLSAENSPKTAELLSAWKAWATQLAEPLWGGQAARAVAGKKSE
jgi:hypothetical protein